MSTASLESIPNEFASASAMLHRELLEMTVSVRGQLEEAVGSLLGRDASLVEEVFRSHKEIIAAKRILDFQGLEILVTFQFSEERLRMILGTMQISRKVCRISDHLADIARRSRELMEMPESYETNLIEPVYEEIFGMLNKATELLADHDVIRPKVFPTSKNLDFLVKGCFSRLTNSAESNDGKVECALNLAFVVNSLKGIAVLVQEIGLDLCSAQTIQGDPSPNGSTARIAGDGP